MKNSPFAGSSKLFGRTEVLAAVALLIANKICLAQDYDITTVKTYDLGRAAGYADRTQPVAPIVSRPDGGAYIQWAESADWNNGNRDKANSRVFVTEITNTGDIVGTDIELGRGQPGGLAATDDSFGYSLWGGNKLEFNVYGSSPTMVMNNDLSQGQCKRVEGLQFLDSKGSSTFGWDVPYLPYSDGRGALAFGGGKFGSIFSHGNCWTNNNNDKHQSDSTIFFDSNGNKLDGKGYIWGPGSGNGHSEDQRMVYDESGNTFFAVSLGDGKGLELAKFNSQGTLQTTGVTSLPFSGSNGISYLDASNNLVPDTPYRYQGPNWEGQWTEQIDVERYGLPGNGGGRTSGLLGDLHVVGKDKMALTYAAIPEHYYIYRDPKPYGSQSLWTTKNHLVLALMNGNGDVSLRKIVYQAESRSGQGPYNDYLPYERVSWVKSAYTGSSIVIFFQTETWNGEGSYETYNDPPYIPQAVQMVQVDLQGNVEQGPTTLPASTGFNRGDGVAVLSNKSLAWTHTLDGTLKLSILAPPGQVSSLPDTDTSTTTKSSDFVAKMKGVGSKKCVTPGDSGITIQTCDLGSSNQKILFEGVSGLSGTYRLVFGEGGGKCLSTNGDWNGVDMKPSECNTSTYQQFELVDVGDDQYEIRSRRSGLSLDVENNVASNGGIVQQWKYKGLTNQRWILDRSDNRRRGLRAGRASAA